MGAYLYLAKQHRRFPTRGEERLWEALRRNVLGVRFRRQHPLPPYIVDFACIRERLVVEVDGPHHDATAEYDAIRDEVLAGEGWTTLRFSADEAELLPERVVEAIGAWLKENGRNR